MALSSSSIKLKSVLFPEFGSPIITIFGEKKLSILKLARLCNFSIFSLNSLKFFLKILFEVSSPISSRKSIDNSTPDFTFKKRL